MLTPTNIKSDVFAVLRQANTWLSAYQILERLPVRDTLITERGMPGAGSGTSYGAASVVAQAIQMLEKEDGYQKPIFMNGRDVAFEVQGQLIRSGYEALALYRITNDTPAPK